MLNKFSESMTLLRDNFFLFAAITLTIWLPGNLLTLLIDNYYVDESGLSAMKAMLWIEGIFGPISAGAIVYALYQIKSGHAVTYKEAMSIGFKKWGSLFTARLVTGLLIILGLFALVIPGIILIIRYSFLDAAVVLENKDTSEARSRSAKLTEGRRWQIFGAGLLFLIGYGLISVAIYMPLGLYESLNIIPIELAMDCILDIVAVIIQIVIFLFYWEATQKESLDEKPAEAPLLPPAIEPKHF